MSDSAETKCLHLAARQHGLLRRDQIREAGLSSRQIDRRVERRHWERVLPGVYRLAGAPRTWEQRLMAASLWAARGFAISHRSAAALFGFARYRPGPVELSVTRNLRLAPPAVLHRVRALGPRDLSSVHGLTVTSVTRTLVDLGAAETEQDLRACVDEALRRKWTTLDQLEAALERVGYRHGVAFLRRLVASYSGGEAPTESELEARVFELLDAEGLPRPVKQAAAVSGRRLRLDFRFPGTPVVIEADGFAYHSSAAMFERDRDRNDLLVASGLRVHHWTWAGLNQRPEVLVARLRRSLAATAWYASHL